MINGLILTLVLGLFIVVGALIALFAKKSENFITLAIGIAFGCLLMLMIFDLTPEVIEIFYSEFKFAKATLIITIFVIIGILILKLLDLFIPDHDHEEKHEEKHLHHIGIISSVALILHNIIEGMAIFSVYKTNGVSSYLLGIGVGLHNIPLGMVISTMFLNYNKDKKKTLLICSLVAISTFIGGLIMFLLNNIINEITLGILLSITLGMIIYITFFELFIHIKNEGDKKISIIGIIIGIILIGISLLV